MENGRKRPRADATAATEDLGRSQRSRRAPTRYLSPILEQSARHAGKPSELAAGLAATPRQAEEEAAAPIAEHSTAAADMHEEHGAEEPVEALDVSIAKSGKPDRSASGACGTPAQPAPVAEAAAPDTQQPSVAAATVTQSGKICRSPTAAADRPSGGPAHALGSLTGPSNGDAVPSSSAAIEQPAVEPDAQPAATAVQQPRSSTRLASSAAEVTASTQVIAPELKPQKAKKATGAVPKKTSAPKRGTLHVSACSDPAVAATPASKAHKTGRSSPGAVPDSVPSLGQPPEEHAEKPACVPPMLRSSARAAVKSPSAFVPERAHAKNSRRITSNLEQTAPPPQAVPVSMPVSAPASAPQALRRSVRAAVEGPSASAPEQAPAKRSGHCATKPKQAAPPAQALPDYAPVSSQASVPRALKRSAQAAVKSPRASAPREAPTKRSRRSATTPKQAAPVKEALPDSTPTSVPASVPQALERSARAAAKGASASALEQATPEHTRCSAAASEQATPAPEVLSDSMPARKERSRRTAGKAAENAVQKPTPVQKPTLSERGCAADAPMQAAVTPEASAKRAKRDAAELERSASAAQPVSYSAPTRKRPSRHRAGEAAEVSVQAATPPVKCSSAAAIMQAAATPETVPDSVPPREQGSRRRASRAAEGLQQGLTPPVTSSSAAAAVQAAAAAKPPTKRSLQASVAPVSQTADATTHQEESLTLAAGALSAPARSSAPEQKEMLGCSKCRHAPKGCKKCRPQPEQALQSRANGVDPAKAVKSRAASAAKPQRRIVDEAAPESEQCAKQPGVDTTQVSRVPSTSPCPWTRCMIRACC